MSSIGQYKSIDDVISDLNVMITEAPLPNKERCQLADIVGQLEGIPNSTRQHIAEKGDCIALHHDD
tara:strand:+ start:2474 stop:2671 length:198 start_codon:yes stop_codon:yes gene_type:complete